MNADQVRTKQDFLRFIYDLRDLYRDEPSKWQNNTTASFLDALGGRVEHIEGAYRSWEKEVRRTSTGT